MRQLALYEHLKGLEAKVRLSLIADLTGHLVCPLRARSGRCCQFSILINIGIIGHYRPKPMPCLRLPAEHF